MKLLAPYKNGLNMGLFDEIYFEPRLPLPKDVDKELCLAIEKFLDEDVFQTKDFENVMTRYVVTMKGALKEINRYSESTNFYEESEPISIDKNITCYGIINVSEHKNYWLEYEIIFKKDIMVGAKVSNWHEMES